MGTLGLSRAISACWFDVDGVLTETARTHIAAWKEMFDSYAWAQRENTPLVAFDPVADFDGYVDGNPPYSKTPSPASQPAKRADSATWWGQIGPGQPINSPRTVPTGWLLS
jgi:beta-phosphoglucomutase-like phosphatase (HAD superfamily)